MFKKKTVDTESVPAWGVGAGRLEKKLRGFITTWGLETPSLNGDVL